MLNVDMRAGSKNLPPYLREHGLSINEGIGFASDVEFIGSTGLGDGTPIGIEHKLVVTNDVFDSLSTGRLTGTQLPTMVEMYPWVRYIIIEGPLRRSKDGILEKLGYGHRWEQAYSRKGNGWTYDEFQNRIESIQDAFSAPNCQGRTVVKFTYDAYETAAYIAGRYHYWQKPYHTHSSAGQWDRSKHLASDPTDSPLMPKTRDIPLVRLWAADIDGIGPMKSIWVAKHFGSPLALANGSIEQWREVEYRDKRGIKRYHFSDATIRQIRSQIGHPVE